MKNYKKENLKFYLFIYFIYYKYNCVLSPTLGEAQDVLPAVDVIL